MFIVYNECDYSVSRQDYINIIITLVYDTCDVIGLTV